MAKWWLLSALFYVLNGCSLLPGGGDDAVNVAELTQIQDALQLKARWKADSGGVGKHFLNLVPAYDNGKVYVSDYKGSVQAFNANNGKRIWKAKADVQVSSGPGVGDGIVLLGTSDGEVVALNAKDGVKLWSAPVAGEVLSIPRVALGIAGIQTSSGDLIGLDVKDGQRRWIYDRSVPTLTLRGTSSPALVDGLIVGGFASGKLSAIEITGGRMIWEVSVAVPRGRSELERMVDIDSTPIIRDGVIYVVSFQGKIAALQLETGGTIWNRDMSSSAGLGVDDKQVYVTDEQSNVWALDRRSGASLWKQEDLHGRALTAPTPFGDYIAVGDFEGYLHLLSRENGQIVGRVRVDRDGISAAPVVSDNTLYVLGKGGTLAAYEVRQDKKRQGRKQKKQKELNAQSKAEKPEKTKKFEKLETME